MDVNIEDIRKLASENQIQWRGHMLSRMRQRNIKIRDVISCILNGEIIEDYPDDFPFPSCLILGSTESSIKLHVVCSIGQGNVWMITSYFPDRCEWCDDFKTRRRPV